MPECPIAVIVDIVLNNPRYGEDRAMEMISEAKRTLDQFAPNPEEAAKNVAQYHIYISNAISLLALSRTARIK